MRRIASVAISIAIAAAALVAVPAAANAVPVFDDGLLDTAYSTAMGTGPGSATRVLTVAAQSDGRVVAAGIFTTFNSVAAPYIVRLNSDGSPDTAFTTAQGTGLNGNVTRVAVQADGKILVGGDFTKINDVNTVGLARLNPDGSPDTAFNAGIVAGGDNSGFNGYVLALKQQSDGKILAGGTFTALNGVTRPNLVRLNTDGTVDEAFDTALAGATSVAINDIALQANGNILLGTIAPTALMRLTPAGAVDTSFTTAQGAGFNDEVKSIGQQSDGSIVVGGYFTGFDGGGTQAQAAGHIARLSADGVLDTTFTTNAALDDNVFSLAIQADDAIVADGDILKTYATKSQRVVRLAADGTFDTAYASNVGDGPDNRVYSIALTPNGQAVVGGSMETFDSVASKYIARLDGPAVNIASISPTTGPLAGGPVLTVRGSGFTGTPVVTVGGITCTSPTVVDATTLTCVLGAHAAGTVDVSVVNAGVTLHLPGAFTYSATTALSVTSGVAQSCAITAARNLDCWGNGNARQTTPPTGTFTQASSGYYHGCAVATDASLACWGGGLSGSNFGQATPPSTGAYSQVSAGVGHSCAVVNDGTVTCWGRNTSGESTAPAGTFTQVSNGGDWNSGSPIDLSCGVHTGGTLACWGDNTDGRATPPAGTYTQVSVGYTFACAVNTNHRVVCWGTDTDSVISTATSSPALEVSTGGGYACARLLNASITCWGGNSYGSTSQTPAGSVTSLGTGYHHSCAVTVSQAMKCWGFNHRGQLGFELEPQGFYTTSPPTAGTTLSSYSLQLEVKPYLQTYPTMFRPPVTTFAVTDGALPSGVTLSSSGLLSGMPTTAGDYSFEVTSTSLWGTRAATFLLTIAPADVTVTADSPTSITPGTSIPLIGYTTDPATVVGDWSVAPTCAVYASSDSGFATALTGTQPAGTYVTHCSGGTSTSYNPTSYVNGSLVIDGSVPTVGVTSLPVFESGLGFTVKWTASGGVTSITNTDVRYRKALWNASLPNTYTTWKSRVTARSATFTGTQGYKYCFSTRARNLIGNLSGWSAEKCTIVPFDERTLATTGAWTKSTPSGWVAKTALQTTTKGAALRTKKSVSVKRIGLIALKCKDCGSVTVQVGTFKKTVSLAGGSKAGTRTLFTIVLPSKKTGKIAIIVTSKSGKVVKIDGLDLSTT